MHPFQALKKWSDQARPFTSWEKLEIFLLLFIFSGLFGFVYETIFYRIDLGHFVKRGTTLGPWIPIYSYGAAFILLIGYRLRQRPWAVFLVSMVSSGALEYAVGWFFWTKLHTRLWDYNTEIWNWGNIDGYICARSVLFFGLSGLILVYILVPVVMRIADRMSKRAFTLLTVPLSVLYAADIIQYYI